jgi:NAD-dependent deacetylase
LSIGTSSIVHPAASLPVEALRKGILTIEVNPEQTPMTSLMTFVLAGPSGTVLPKLVSATWST